MIFPTELAPLYDKAVANNDAYSSAVISEFGHPRPFFDLNPMAPPRACDFIPEFSDSAGRDYISYADRPEYLGVRLPPRTGSSPTYFPEPNEIISTSKGTFRVIDLILAKTRCTTALLQIDWIRRSE
jgi:hypothetical protein